MSELGTEYQNQNNLEPHIIADKMLNSDKELNLCKDYHFVTLKDSKEMFYYDHNLGVYRSGTEVLIEEYCKKEVPDCSTHFRNEVIGHIQILTYRNRDVFDSNPNEITLLNGIYDLELGELMEQSHGEPKRVQIPIVYDATAKCPNFMKFLNEILPDEEERIVILEEIASCFWRSAALQRAYIWVGGGANGKSTLHKVIHAVLGKDNVSQISIHSLINNRFAPARLDAKLANVFSDISNKEISQTGVIKSIITGDPLDVEHKNKNFFRMEPYCKIFFSCNQLPEVIDQTDAFFRRWIITEFTQKFEGDADNPNLINELTTAEELSGIFNLLLPIIKKLMLEKRFSRSPSTEQIRIEWGERADPIKAFSSDALILDLNSVTPKQDVYNKYLRWCNEKKFITKGQKTFGSKLQSFTGIIEDFVKVDGKTVRAWKGIRLNEKVTMLRCHDLVSLLPEKLDDNIKLEGSKEDRGNVVIVEPKEE